MLQHALYVGRIKSSLINKNKIILVQGVISMRKPIRTMTSAAIIAMIANQASYAGAFSLYTESSAAAIGNFAAGIAAEAADASIGWYNPAGLVLIKEQQALLGGVGVFPSTQLSGTSTYISQNPASPSSDPFVYSEPFSNLQGAENALVPSLHYALPLGERAAFGLSIVAPFGLSTSWDPSSAVRYAATLTKLTTYNVSPELAGFLTNNISIGGGIDFQYATVEFNRTVGSPALLTLYPPVTGLDTQSNNQGNSFGIGFHAGTLFMFNDNHTRIGVNYQSEMRHQFNGYSELSGRLADSTFNVQNLDEPYLANLHAKYRTNTLTSNNVALPAVVTLSAYQDLNEKLALLGSLVYTGWGSFRTIELKNIAAGVPISNLDSPDLGLIVLTPYTNTTTEGYRNTWRTALGANYHVNQAWMLRLGGGYDQTPTVNAYRDVRLPDADRWALSVGAHYQPRPSLGFDAGYTYLFGAGNSTVNNTQAIGAHSTNTINAIAENHAQLFGLQVVWMIDQVKPEITK